MALKMAPQRLGRRRLAVQVRHIIGKKTHLTAAVGPGDHGGAGDAGLGGQGGLDLAGFDTHAADFNLGVVAPEEGQRSILAPGDAVAAAVEAAQALDLDEPLGRQLRRPNVPIRQPRPADAKLASRA